MFENFFEKVKNFSTKIKTGNSDKSNNIKNVNIIQTVETGLRPVSTSITPIEQAVKALKPNQPLVIPQDVKKFELETSHQFNWQRNNKIVEGISPSSQCGYTTIAVVLSEDIPEAKDDKFIAEMIAKFEPGFATGTKSRFALRMDNHVKIYEYYLQKYAIKKRVKFFPYGGTFVDIMYALQNNNAVELAGMMTPSGHFMPCCGFSQVKNALKIHDPWAKFDFKTGKYTSQSGENSWYAWDDFFPYLEKSSLAATGKKGIRMLYLEDIK